jgi:tetratricopeptide (TPR) repeat protein
MPMPSRRPTLVVLVVVLVCAAAAAQNDSLAYLDVVLRYRTGRFGDAVEEVARMPLAKLRERVDDALWSLNCRTNAGLDKCRGLIAAAPKPQQRVFDTWRATYPAALLMHLEVIDVLFRAKHLDGVDVHRQIVRDLLARMREATAMRASVDAAGVAALETVRRRGQLLFIWGMQGQLDHGMVESELTRMLRESPDDPELLLANAWLSEFRARPQVLREMYRQRTGSAMPPGDRESWLRREQGQKLSEAERRYRQVLAADPKNAEAQLRLGRVITLTGHAGEARQALTRSRELTEDRRLRYLSLLFEADARERAGDAGGARDSYGAALRIWPTGQSARLGLSRLRLLERDYAGARELLPRQASGALGSGEPGDPWAWYQYGQWWRVASAFDAMKAELRR